MKPRKNPAWIAMITFGLMLGLSSCTAEAKEGNKEGNQPAAEKSDANMEKPDANKEQPASKPAEKK